MEKALQEAWGADPNAMYALCCNRVPCNAALADHEHAVVDAPPVLSKPALYQVGMIGVINGMLAAAGEDWLLVTKWSSEVDNEGRHTLLGLEFVPRSQIKYE